VGRLQRRTERQFERELAHGRCRGGTAKSVALVKAAFAGLFSVTGRSLDP
jgi:hypothetical protein